MPREHAAAALRRRDELSSLVLGTGGRDDIDARSAPGYRRRPSVADQLKSGIVELIRDRNMRPGDRLPSEAELVAHFDVSRVSVREALKLLEQDGVVYAVQGRGRFVSASASLRVERPVTTYESVTEMLVGRGYTVTTMVFDVSEQQASEELATQLDLEIGDRVIRLVRLRLGNDEPMVFSVDIIPRTLLPGPLRHRNFSRSVNEALAGHGHRIESSVARITAANLPGEFAESYGLAGLDPWLVVQEACVTDDGRKVLWAQDYHRGDEFAFNVLRRR